MTRRATVLRHAFAKSIHYVAISCLLALHATQVYAAAVVGRTPGAFAVSAGGAATYTIPIWAPPGPAGVQPHVALTYNSQQGNGFVGVGWSLSGLSSIYRCNLTYAQDPAPAPVALTTADGLCLDGKRLRLTSGTYGQAGSTYQTEITDFSNVTAQAAAGNGPGFFQVQARNGWTYEYGNGNSSQVLATGTSTPSSWMLDKITDRAGNTLIVTYQTLTGTAVPSSIYWTPAGYSSTSYQYAMTFGYGTPAGQGQFGYLAGTAVANSNLLQTITIKYSGTVVKEYFLSYQTSSTTGRYKLTGVQECADSGAANCLAPTTIAYQGGSAGSVHDRGHGGSRAVATPAWLRTTISTETADRISPIASGSRHLRRVRDGERIWDAGQFRDQLRRRAAIRRPAGQGKGWCSEQ